MTHTQDRMVSSSEIMSAREAAEALEISVGTLSRWVDFGKIRPLRAEPLVFHRDDVELLIRARDGRTR